MQLQPPTIAVLMAMQAEAQPVIDRLGLVAAINPWPAATGVRAYLRPADRSSDRDAKVIVVHLGMCDRFGVDNIGTQPATLATYLTLTAFAPDLVISAGTCGGFRQRGAAIGDVYLADQAIVFHDRRIDLPGFDRYGLGSYAPADLRDVATELGLKLGVVSSGNSLDLPPSDLAVMDRVQAKVKDMEAAAVAWVCERFDTPVSALKAVTDLVDGDRTTSEEFLDNLHHASDQLCRALLQVLKHLGEQDPRTWRRRS